MGDLQLVVQEVTLDVRIGRCCFAALFVWLNFMCVPSARAEQAFCHGKREGKVPDNSVTRKYDQGVGFNPSQYISQRYVSTPWLLAAADKPDIEISREREKFKTEKLKAFIKDRGGITFDVPAVLDLIDQGGFSTVNPSGRNALWAAVRIYEEKAAVDCGTRSYSYSVEFLMAKNPLQVIPYPVRIALEDAVESAVAQAFPDGVKDVLTFRLDEIINSIRTQLAANERLMREFDKPETRAACGLLHPRFKELFPQQSQISQDSRSYTFGVGAYRLPPEMAYVIEQIVRRFLRRPEAQESSFGLVVKGYADATPVREIPYDGTCQINSRLNMTTELTDSSDKPAQLSITSNAQLSVARGCEGARLAKALIPPTRRIRVFYAGGGAVESTPQDLYRRIELRFERNL